MEILSNIIAGIIGVIIGLFALIFVISAVGGVIMAIGEALTGAFQPKKPKKSENIYGAADDPGTGAPIELISDTYSYDDDDDDDDGM